jgi:hypothetical protein
VSKPAKGARAGPAVLRPPGTDDERTFYCRGCQLVERGRHMPEGWYALERVHPRGRERGRLRLGLYCCAACLVARLPEIEADEREHARRLGISDRFRDRQRLVDRAVTLLGRGMTIRQAGDVIDVPTSSLRHWLREAGVKVNERGVLP